MKLKWKILFILLIIIVVLEFLLICYNAKYPVMLLPKYSFSDYFRGQDVNDNYICIKGTWVSDTKLADPLQTTKLDCWRELGYCFDNTARIFQNDFLMIDTTLYRIESWTPDEITCRDNESALCVTYSLVIDRKNKTVTSVRNTKKPKPEGCDGVQDEPIFMHLGDIYKTNK